MRNDDMENTIFNVLNVDNEGEVVVRYADFKFEFFIVRKSSALDTIINTKNGYIECSDGNGKFLYVHCGSSTLKINSLKKFLNTNFYFISNGRFRDFNEKGFCFRFSGGIINKVFPPYALTLKEEKDNEIIIEKQKYYKKIDMKLLDKSAKINFYSGYQYSHSISKGFSIKETDSSMEIIGDFSMQELFKLEYEFSRLFSFMTFRKIENDYFIDIILPQKINNEERYESVATCFYRTIGERKSSTKKDFLNMITVNLLSNDQFVELYNIVNSKNKFGFNIDFVPEDEKFNLISKTRIKETVSALECMLNKYKICDKNKETENFIQELNEEIDSKNDESIDNEIKAQLKNALRYATYPIKKRIKTAYIQCEEVANKYIEYLKKNKKDFATDIDKIIEDTLKYRDYNTHNEKGGISENVMEGVVVFDAIIYIIVLEQIGINKEYISVNLSQWLQ